MSARSWAASVLLALGGHVAVVALMQGGSVALPRARSEALPTVQVRWMPAATPDRSDPVVEADRRSPRLRDAAVEPARSATTSKDDPTPLALANAGTVSASPPGPSASQAARSVDEDRYWPRDLLHVGPQPTAGVVVDYPAFDDDLGHYVAVLALFIDESGVVRKLRFEGSPLPRSLEESVRQAFLSARFAPGQVDGAAVRSLIRIEVRFDRAGPA